MEAKPQEIEREKKRKKYLLRVWTKNSSNFN